MSDNELKIEMTREEAIRCLKAFLEREPKNVNSRLLKSLQKIIKAILVVSVK